MMLVSGNFIKSLPSVSLLVPLKSSSLVIFRGGKLGPAVTEGIIVDDVEGDWCVDPDGKEDVEGNNGLHGECEPTDALEEVAKGTPPEEYSS